MRKTYIAVVLLSLVVIVGNHESADRLQQAAMSGYAINRSVVRLRGETASAASLPPALAETIPHLPAIESGGAAALVCTGFTCQPPTSDPDTFRTLL